MRAPFKPAFGLRGDVDFGFRLTIGPNRSRRIEAAKGRPERTGQAYLCGEKDKTRSPLRRLKGVFQPAQTRKALKQNGLKSHLTIKEI